jgi:hypothetical protein
LGFTAVNSLGALNFIPATSNSAADTESGDARQARRMMVAVRFMLVGKLIAESGSNRRTRPMRNSEDGCPSSLSLLDIWTLKGKTRL